MLFNDKNRDYIVIILIALVSFGIYFNSLSADFIFDDIHMIVENPLIKIPARILSFFTAGQVSLNQQVKGMYRPLLMVTFLFNYFFGGLNPVGYHIINIMFHFLNGILFFLLTKMLFEKSIYYGYKEQEEYHWPLLFASLLFVVHPINSEAVNYISARSSLMVTFFILFSLFMYIKKDSYFDKKRTYFYFGSIFLFIGALFAKESAVMFPFIIILYDIHFNKFKDFLKLIIKNYIPFFIIVLLYLGLRIKLFGGLIKENYIFTRPIFTNILIQIKVIVYYLKLFIWPFDLCIDRYFSGSKSIFEPKILLSVVLLLSLIIIALRAFNKKRLISFSIFWFFINLVPISTIIPFNIVMSEHRFYLPGVGLFFLIAGISARLPILNKYFYRRSRFIISVIIIAILIAFSIVTIKRNTIWHDALTLWQDTVRVSPKSFRAHNDLGIEFLKINEYDKAMGEFKKAIELRGPYEARLFCNLTYAYIQRGYYDEAVRNCNEALKINSNCAEAHHNLGLIYQKKGNYDKAVQEYKEAIRLDPNIFEAYNNLGLIYCQRGQYKEAIEEYKRALIINPDSEVILNNIANSYSTLNKLTK